MIVTLDANALVTWAAEKKGDLDVARLDGLFAEVAKARGRLIFPTPALAELFVRNTVPATAAWLAALERKQAIKVANFDRRAAVECAEIHRRAEAAGGKRQHVKASEAYQKIKVDRQIVAIALVERSDVLVTSDDNLRAVCANNGLRALAVGDLSLPDSARQLDLHDTLVDEVVQEVIAEDARRDELDEWESRALDDEFRDNPSLPTNPA